MKKMKRIAAIALVTVLVCAPLYLLYGRLDYSAVPPEMAALAVPARRYELCTMQMTLPAAAGGEEDIQMNVLYCYNADDLVLRQITYSGGGTGPFYSDCTYNADGKLLRRVAYTVGIQIQEDSAYDGQGRLLAQQSCSVEQDTQRVITRSMTTYTYRADGAGEAVTETRDAFDLPAGTERCLLDRDGRVVQKEMQMGGGTWLARYQYDGSGNLTLSELDTGEEVTKNEYRRTYDADGNCIVCETYQNGVYTGRETSAYQDGHLRERRTEDAGGGLTVERYADVTK